MTGQILEITHIVAANAYLRCDQTGPGSRLTTFGYERYVIEDDMLDITLATAVRQVKRTSVYEIFRRRQLIACDNSRSRVLLAVVGAPPGCAERTSAINLIDIDTIQIYVFDTSNGNISDEQLSTYIGALNKPTQTCFSPKHATPIRNREEERRPSTTHD